MKRCWIGVGLLIALLLLGSFSSVWMGRFHSDMAQDVKAAGEAVLQEDWERALGLTRQVNVRWERRFGLSAALSDHEPMEQINALLAQLETYAAAGDAVSFAGVCAQLGEEMEAMADAHGMQWWNLM